MIVFSLYNFLYCSMDFTGSFVKVYDSKQNRFILQYGSFLNKSCLCLDSYKVTF